MNFAIYFSDLTRGKHSDPDRAFNRAALTWLREVEQEAPGSKISFPFTTLPEFVSMVGGIATEAKGGKILRGAFFVHSFDAEENARSWGGPSLEVLRHTGISRREREAAVYEQARERGLATNRIDEENISKIPRLPWDPKGKLAIYGCDSGGGNNSIAQIFAKSQGVETYGEVSSCSFSAQKNQYVRIGAATHNVYLRAYKNPFSVPTSWLPNAAAPFLPAISGRSFGPDGKEIL